jgi:SAM-dependent methyltransferase
MTSLLSISNKYIQRFIWIHLLNLRRYGERYLMGFASYGVLCTEVYDLTKPIAASYPDVPYYKAHLSQISGRILEAMVGSGRLLIPLLQAGLQVEGVDSSLDMLAACRKNCADRGLNPVLYEGAIDSLALPHRYSAIVVSFGSFLLLETRSRAVAALQTFARHLEPKGHLFIDLFLPIDDFKTEQIVQQSPPIVCPDGAVILMQTSVQIDWLNQLVVKQIRYEKWQAGRLVACELQRLPLHWFGKDEFVACLQANGYTNIRLCANYIDALEPASHQDILCFAAQLC